MAKSEDTNVMIEAKNISKFFRDFKAVYNANFQVKKGKITAFLGPNGAGKTTTMRILTGYMAPSSGQVTIGGLDVQKNRLEVAKKLGYLPENGPLYQDMTPAQIISFTGEVRGIVGAEFKRRFAEVVELCKIETVVNKPVGKLSRGYKQRVGLANVLLHDPEVMILDEPTSGLDPNQILHIRKVLKDLGKNKTILLSTHILQEVRAIADEVIFISNGQVHDKIKTVQDLGADEASMEQTFYKLSSTIQDKQVS